MRRQHDAIDRRANELKGLVVGPGRVDGRGEMGHQARRQALENDGLEIVAANVEAVVAGALVARGGIAEKVDADLGMAAAAGTALQETRERILGPCPLPKRTFRTEVGAGVLLDCLLAGFERLSEILVDDPELGDLLYDPFGGDGPIFPSL